MNKESNIIFGVKPVIEAINAGKEIDKLYIQRDITGAGLSELRNAIKKAKPATVKGVYMKKITLSSTMGPGIKIDYEKSL